MKASHALVFFSIVCSLLTTAITFSLIAILPEQSLARPILQADNPLFYALTLVAAFLLPALLSFPLSQKWAVAANSPAEQPRKFLIQLIALQYLIYCIFHTFFDAFRLDGFDLFEFFVRLVGKIIFGLWIVTIPAAIGILVTASFWRRANRLTP